MNANTINNANTNAAEQITINLDTMIIDGKVMSKQKKMVKKIKNAAIADAKGLNKKKEDNDECYTAYDDIYNELKHWGELGKLRGKNIICPCDWDITVDSDVYRIRVEFNEDVVSNDWDTIINRIVTTTVQRSVWTDMELGKQEIKDLLYDKLKCNFVGVLIDNAREWGVKSITASGYNPDLDKGFKFQDVDYSQYDVCITNPPFSLYGEFLKCIIGKIDFVVLAPTENRVTPLKGGLYLQTREMYLGFGRAMDLGFYNPSEENNYKTLRVRCDWWTSWFDAQEAKNKEDHKSGIPYELYKNDYVECPNMTMKDGTHPIRVPGSAIPEGYNGWMFTDIFALSNLNTDKYEFYGTNYKGYFNKVNPEANPLAHKMSDTMIKKAVSGTYYHGYLIRRRPETIDN